MSEIQQYFELAIKSQKKTKGKFTLMLGTVKSINGDTCIVDNYEDVSLNSVTDDLNSQFTIYPKVGSQVVFGRLESEDNTVIVKVSEIDKITVKIGEQILEMKDGKFTIKVGEISLKSILNKAFERLKIAVINTPSGPGNFSPADVVEFEKYNTEVNQLLQ